MAKTPSRTGLLAVTMIAMAGGLLGGCSAAKEPAEPTPPGAPTAATIAANEAVKKALDFSDVRDFELADRGFIATRSDPLIKAANGAVVWNLGARDFLKGEAPATVNPSLWRTAQLMAKHGLYKAADRVWQVRGFDLANVTFVKGDTGWIVIDPLTSNETARAAFDLLREHEGDRPITAIIYSHSHGDHFGGGQGLLEFGAADVPIIAPEGFLEEAISENLIAGPAMRRRAMYHVGDPLATSAEETIGSGLGAGLANGTHTMAPPNRFVSRTGEEMTIDGVRMVFQVTSGTEAPAEFNVGFPDLGVANIAENANPMQHNILTPRGAQVRDAKQWADDLSEAVDLFDYADVLVVSHGWPRFGKEEIRDYLSKQRDAYKFLHDQTVRLMNKGYTPNEIAASLKLPEVLAKEWYNRPYYGEFSFNARAVYQHYLGWFDANPVHFQTLPPVEAGKKYVAAMGGGTSVLEQADAAYAEGDYVWASELLNHLVFSGEETEAAKGRLADTYEQLGWQAENALWRNFYLSAAKELRDGVKPLPGGLSSQAMTVLNGIPTTELFDILATQLNPEKAGKSELHLGFVFPDRGEEIYISIANGVMTRRATPGPEKLDGKITVNRTDFLLASTGQGGLAAKILSGEAKLDGNPNAFRQMTDWLEKPDPAFNIVTP